MHAVTKPICATKIDVAYAFDDENELCEDGRDAIRKGEAWQ